VPIFRDQFRAFCLLIVTVAISGCGEESASTEPRAEIASAAQPETDASEARTRRAVTGLVKLDDQPLVGATVYFSPLESGTAAFGTTDSEGRYTLMFSKTDPGIAPGRYHVRVTTAGSIVQGGFSNMETVPRVYNEESTLYRDVTSETTEIPLLLESDADVQRFDRRRRGMSRAPIQNILLIVADGLGPEWISCYGSSSVETPNIDALAARGIKFTNAYAMPNRSASRVTLLTGQYPFRHGWVGDWDVPQSARGCWFDWNRHQTFARRLAINDFSTSIAGQWQLNDFRRQPDALLQHGFRRWCVWTGEESGNPASRNQYQDPYIYLNRGLTRDAEGWPSRNLRQYDWGGAGTFVDKFGPEVYAHFVKNTVSRASGFRQFIYYSLTLPSSAQQEAVARSGRSDAQEHHREKIRYTDQLIGDLIDWLDVTRQRRGTVVILTSDGGSPPGVVGTLAGREVEGGRGTLTERGVRVPLIVAYPSPAAAGRESDCLVDFTDLAPTICDLAMLRPVKDEPAFDGRSFAAVIAGQPPDEPREWIMAMGGGPLEFDGESVVARDKFVERVLRDHRYKVHVTTARTIDALYDLESDPAEQQNLISSDAPEHVQARQKFQKAVDAFPEQDAALEYAPLTDPFESRTTAAPAPGVKPAS